jgi:D-alanine-D-alanine ligase
MKKVVVLYGGKSGEHEVSRLSAASVVKHLDHKSFEPILVGIRKTGEWILQRPGLADEVRGGRSPLPIEEGPRVLPMPGGGLLQESWGRVEPLACDIVFPVLHGTFGEDGIIQGLLEAADLAYVGSPVLGSALGMDKEKAKIIWRAAGIPVLDWITARKRDLEPGRLEALAARVGKDLGWPAFVKPVSAGSSVGAGKAAGPEALGAALASALEWDERAIIEPFCPAREIECAVLGNTGWTTEAFAPGEVIPSHEFYDYEAKYIDPDGARLDIPARIPGETAERIRKVAIEAFEALEICGLSRVDFFLEKGGQGLWLNEVNTLPGFTSISMYPKMCEAGGLPYPELLARLIGLGFERHALRKALRFSYA